MKMFYKLVPLLLLSLFIAMGFSSAEPITHDAQMHQSTHNSIHVTTNYQIAAPAPDNHENNEIVDIILNIVFNIFPLF